MVVEMVFEALGLGKLPSTLQYVIIGLVSAKSVVFCEVRYSITRAVFVMASLMVRYNRPVHGKQQVV